MWYAAVLAVSVLRAYGVVQSALFVEDLEVAPVYDFATEVSLPESSECANVGFNEFHSMPLNSSEVVVDAFEDAGLTGRALSCPCSCQSQQCSGMSSCSFFLRLAPIPAVKRFIFKCHSCSLVRAVDFTTEVRSHGVPEQPRYVVVEGTRLSNIMVEGPAPQANEISIELHNQEDCAHIQMEDERPDCGDFRANCQDRWPGSQQLLVTQVCPFTCGVCTSLTSPTPTTVTSTSISTTPEPVKVQIKVEQRLYEPEPSSWSRPPMLVELYTSTACFLGDTYSFGLRLDPETITTVATHEDWWNQSSNQVLALGSPCYCRDQGVCPMSLSFAFDAFPPVKRVTFMCRLCSNVTVRDHANPAVTETFSLDPDGDSYISIRSHRIFDIVVTGENPSIRHLQYAFGALEDCRHPFRHMFELCSEFALFNQRCNETYDSRDFTMFNWELCPVTCQSCPTSTISTSTTWTATATTTSTTTTATNTTTTQTNTTTTTTGTNTTTYTSETMTTTTLSTRTSTLSSVTTMTTSTVWTAEPISEAEEELLQELFRENVTQVVTRSEASTMVAKQLSVSQEQVDSQSTIKVEVEGTSVAAAIPASLVQEAGGSVVLLVEAASGVDNDYVQNRTNASDNTQLAVPVVSVKLWADGVVVVQGLQEPILLTLSEEAIPNAECVFWNETEQRWSTSGLRRVEGESGLVCATTHLSIFSAILRQLECLNIQVLSAAGLETASSVEWTDKPSAILLYAVMVFWLSLMVFAWRRDLLYLEETDWTDHNFIMKVPPSHRVPIGTDYCKGLCLSVLRLCSRRRAVRGFKWLRTTDTGESLFLYVSLLGVHSQLAVQSGLSVSTLRMHLINKRGWVQNDLATSSCDVLRGRLSALRNEVPKAFVSFFELSFVGCFWVFFQALHPYAVRLCLEQSAAKQIKLKADVMLGALVVAAFFFGVTGSATSSRSPEDCADARMSMARFVLIGFISVSFVSFPISLLAHMWQRSFVDETARGSYTREKQIMFWQLQDSLFWVGSSFYTLFCCMFIALFIANLSELDQWKWLLTFAIIVVRIAIVQPIGMAFLLASAVRYVKSRRPELVRDGHPKLHFKLPKQAAHASIKVKELASRSVSVAELLYFWEKVPAVMPHFDANFATTHDVVRHAIIPLSKVQAQPLESSSYATLIAEGNYRPPDFMVTHNWGNKFCHLIAAILSEAIGEKTYETTAEQLAQNRMSILHTEADKLHRRYWVCCFCVNQHASICDTPPPTDSTGMPFYPCTCGVPKHWSGPFCEMDKFDEMIGYLSVIVPAFSQVVAVDMNFTAFTRIWCIAELAEARKMDLQQFLVVHSDSALQKNLHKIERLDVRDAQASVPEDKDRVLEKIDDKDSFNESVRQLLLDRNVGLLTRFLFDLHGQAGPHDALDAMTHVMVDAMIPGVIE